MQFTSKYGKKRHRNDNSMNEAARKSIGNISNLGRRPSIDAKEINSMEFMVSLTFLLSITFQFFKQILLSNNFLFAARENRFKAKDPYNRSKKKIVLVNILR